MGQILQRMQSLDGRGTDGSVYKFPDLITLPKEIGLLVLSYLDATDLCLAACVWNHLGNDEVLWQR